MQIASITQKQNQIIPLLYKYRFLTIYQFQQLLNHKFPHRINAWLNDLVNKKLISRLKLIDDVTQPYIYCLSQKSKYILTDKDIYDETFLNRLYKEKNLTSNFISHMLLLTDVYLYLNSQKETESTISFYSKHELQGYDYFPEELPDAYIAVENQNDTTRYVLDLFDDYTPLWAIRKRIKTYLQFYEDNIWQEKTENSPFPAILFVLPNKRVLKHITHFGKAVLEKTYYDDINIFLTTKEKIKENGQAIWEKVE